MGQDPAAAIWLADGALTGVEFLHARGVAPCRVSPGHILGGAARGPGLADGCVTWRADEGVSLADLLEGLQEERKAIWVERNG